ncbi:MAG: hypothetical protein U9M90_02075 [Patescibacteria group bacterium]|nr:hypothetical protein [Patescibacteria group bacterium]
MKKILFAAIFIVCGCFIFGSVQAITEKTESETSWSTLSKRAKLKEERKDIREQIKERRCENIEARINTRIKRYENNQAQHRRIFDNLVSRIERCITKFEKASFDVSKLKSDLVVLKKKVQALHDAHALFIDELKNTRDHICGESEGAFVKQLGEARKMIPEVRSKLLDVREYYRTVIRPDLLDLRKQIVDKYEDKSNEETEEGSSEEDNN